MGGFHTRFISVFIIVVIWTFPNEPSHNGTFHNRTFHKGTSHIFYVYEQNNMCEIYYMYPSTG